MTVASTPSTCIPSAVTPPASDDPLDLRYLGKRCDQMLRASATEQEAMEGFVCLARQLTRSAAAVYFGLDDSQQLAANPCGCGAADFSPPALDQLYLLARRAQDAESAQLVQMQAEPHCVAVAVPIFCRDGGIEVLLVVTTLSVDDRRQIAGTLQTAQLLAVFAGQWRGGFDAVRSCARLRLLETLTHAVDAANKSVRFVDAAATFASFLADHFAARLTAIGVRRRGDTCRLVGISHQPAVARGAPLVEILEAVLAERIVMPECDSIEHVELVERGTESIQQLRTAMDTHAVYRAAWRDGFGEVHGACVMIRDQLLTPDEEVDLQQAFEFIGPHLARLRHTRLPWWHRGRVAFDQLTARTRRTVIFTAWGLAFLLFTLPFPHRVKCRCEVQPVSRRFVAAPYEGRLQDVLIEPGDLVHAGQVLAVMDGREIRLELSALDSELQRVTKQRDRALANRETAAAQIALLEMKRLQTNIQLYKDRLANLEIRSPTDGVVISGDPQKLKGARLTIGQTLVEVGPLGKMVLELAIPDEQIALVPENTLVSFRLEAMPQVVYHGRMTRIHPRSELRESKNVFVGEAEIAEDAKSLRPGMRGRAKLAAGRRSLFWILFHRGIDHLLFQLG